MLNIINLTFSVDNKCVTLFKKITHFFSSSFFNFKMWKCSCPQSCLNSQRLKHHIFLKSCGETLIPHFSIFPYISLCTMTPGPPPGLLPSSAMNSCAKYCAMWAFDNLPSLYCDTNNAWLWQEGHHVVNRNKHALAVNISASPSQSPVKWGTYPQLNIIYNDKELN